MNIVNTHQQKPRASTWASESLARAQTVVLLRRLDEVSDVLSRICAHHDLGSLSAEAMRVLGRCRAAKSITA